MPSPAYCSIFVLCFDGELSLVIRMHYFHITHTVIVIIFYSFVCFNILTYNSSGSKNKEGGLYFLHRHFRWYYSQGSLKKKKKTPLVVKLRLIIILELNIRKKVSYVFKIFLKVFHSRPVHDYRISTSVFLVPKVQFSQSQAFNFQNFLGKHAVEGPTVKEREFLELNSFAPLLIPFHLP